MYKKLLSQLSEYRSILVTGPQRSGTTIAANILALDLDYAYFEAGDLLNFLGGSDPRRIDIQDFIKAYPVSFVAQCPFLSSAVHRWANVDGLAIVFVVRPVEDIIASQERIKWGFEAVEKSYYPQQDGPIAQIKYDYWYNIQKPILKDKAFELEYDSLNSHPLWVSKDQRAEFWSRQIQLGLPRGERIQSGGPGIGAGINQL